MMPIKKQFELRVKLYTHVFFFQLDQKQQKTLQKLEIFLILSKNLNFLQFFPKTLKFLQFLPKTFFFEVSVGVSKVSA